MEMPPFDLRALSPAAVLALGAMIVLLLEALLSRRVASAIDAARRPRILRRIRLALAFAALIALVVAAALGSLLLAQSEPIALQSGSPMLEIDALSRLAMLLLALAGGLSIGLAATYLDALHIHHGEYYALLLLSLAGMFVAVAAENLMVLYLAIELMSLPLHVLAGFDRRKPRGSEAGLKHFLSSVFASAILLYGMALLYGAGGELDYAGIRSAVDPASPLALAGLALMLVGLASRVGLVPFHAWLPGVQEGAPTAVSAFLSVAVPTTLFFVLLRFVLHAVPEFEASLRPIFGALSIASIVLGSAMVAFQRNVKRMLAWSGVAHAGTLLVGFVAGTPDAFAAVGFYVTFSLLATLGVFGVVLTLATGGRDSERIDDFAGLGRSRPGLAACMTLFLLALVGIPGTAGFWAKWLLFGAAVEAAALPLVAVALLGTLACLRGTWRVIVLMYGYAAPEAEPIPASTSELAVLALCAAGVLWLGFLPDSLPLGGEGGLLQAVHSLVLRTRH